MLCKGPPEHGAVGGWVGGWGAAPPPKVLGAAEVGQSPALPPVCPPPKKNLDIATPAPCFSTCTIQQLDTTLISSKTRFPFYKNNAFL